MQVDDCTVSWEPGKCLVFDDFFPHEVWNDTDEQRVVLIFDFERPMRRPGRVANAVLMWGIKRTAYFKDAERNLKDWDERLEAAVETADKMLDEPAPPPPQPDQEAGDSHRLAPQDPFTGRVRKWRSGS
jgi:beta-hydroxylase